MKTEALKRIIKEAVREAIQEELKEVLLEAVKAPKAIVTQTNARKYYINYTCTCYTNT